MPRRLSILFDNFGPYHLARLDAASRCFDLLAVEVASQSGDYPWERTDARLGFKNERLLDGLSGKADPSVICSRLSELLDRFRPEVIATPGWSSVAALAALRWGSLRRVPVVVMSESQAIDETRLPWKERAKRRVVGLCSAALAGGSTHVEYLAQLGMPRDRVFIGYDAVDNRYFVREVDTIRSQESVFRTRYHLPARYFLASARFIDKKNLPRLLHAYARYRDLAAAHPPPSSVHSPTSVDLPTFPASHLSTPPSARGLRSTASTPASTSALQSPPPPWSLVLLGDGPLRATIHSQISTLNLRGLVQMPGFIQYPDLPAYYGLGSAFIHPSAAEPWGLVVNEAMAAGLPVLVSNRCGCARDLVQDGVNGFTFDPCDAEQLAQLMLNVSAPSFPLSAYGHASRRIIADWGPERFASGLVDAADKALVIGSKRAGAFDQLLLRWLIRRALWK